MEYRISKTIFNNEVILKVTFLWQEDFNINISEDENKKLQQFCRDSISTWKKSFLPQCTSCVVKYKCSGIFETSFIQSYNIKPITKNIS